MRVLVLACWVLALASSLIGQTDELDPYSIGIVRFELQMRSGGKQVLHSWSQKRLFRLGDGISIALLKILGEEDMNNPQKIREFLPIIRDGFSEPELIAVETDKKPKVTMFLLSYLRQHISDPQVQLDIQQTLEFVKGKTAE